MRDKDNFDVVAELQYSGALRHRKVSSLVVYYKLVERGTVGPLSRGVQSGVSEITVDIPRRKLDPSILRFNLSK